MPATWASPTLYTPADRLQTRQWARGAWTRYVYHGTSGVQTATLYFPAGTPQATVLSAVSGSDPLTPDVDHTFDAYGRLEYATTFSGNSPRVEFTKNRFYYTAQFTLDKEDITVDQDGSGTIPALTRTLDRNQDSIQRSEGWNLLNGASVEHGNSYTYHPSHGRLDTVAGSASTFTYGYTPNAYGLVHSITGPVHTVTNTWLPDRQALDKKENKVGSTNLSTYDYGVNALSQRQDVVTSGTAFTAGSLGTTGWGYDRLGQVVSADHATSSKDFGYSFDAMGNRKRSSRLTTNPATATGIELAIYRSGELPADPEGGNALNRHGLQEFYGEDYPQANTWDEDGNLLLGRYPEGGEVIYPRVWDGENRLITTRIEDGNSYQFTYDAFHRRVAKRTSTSDVNWTIYDGWNPVADYRRTSTTFLESTYTWGLDLSGTVQGAGGVGGLLAVQRHAPASSPGTYYPTYDGNGNISEYLTTGAVIAAHYEYGPFGEATVTSGPQAGLFKHRFSTKPLDTESGYYYYGYRLYDPLRGRWINRDPIQENGGMNLHAMVSNNAVSKIDILGFGSFKSFCCDGVLTERGPTDGNCCGKSVYSPRASCCYDDKVYRKGQAGTGVYKNWFHTRNGPGNNPFGADHAAVSYPGGSVGAYSGTGGMFGGDDPKRPPSWGRKIESPDTAFVDATVDTESEEVKLDPCEYDVDKFLACVQNPAEQNMRFGFILGSNDCRDYQDKLIDTCKSKAKR